MVADASPRKYKEKTVSIRCMATAADVRDLLASTTLPSELVDDLLAGASATWLMGEPADVLAADLALCHPPLAPEEVRAAVTPTDGPALRLTVVTADRPGILAALAGALPGHGLAISAASATTFTRPGLALIRLFVVATGSEPLAKSDWEAVGEDLRSAVGRRKHRDVPFKPASPVEVTATPQESGRSLVTLRAPDRDGLLWAVAAWFESQGANFEVMKLDVEDTTAVGTFVVVCPELDACALAAALGGSPAQSLPGRLARLAARSVMALFGIGAAVAVRSLRAARRR